MLALANPRQASIIPRDELDMPRAKLFSGRGRLVFALDYGERDSPIQKPALGLSVFGDRPRVAIALPRELLGRQPARDEPAHHDLRAILRSLRVRLRITHVIRMPL